MPTEKELKKMWDTYLFNEFIDMVQGTRVPGAKRFKNFQEFCDAINNAVWICDCPSSADNTKS